MCKRLCKGLHEWEGDFLPVITIKDVAQEAGVSISTVSRTLSGNIPVAEETRNRVLKAVKGLGYQPNTFAQALKNGKSRAIGLIIPNFRSLVFPEMINGISDTANKHGYTLVLSKTEENQDLEREYIDSLRRRLIDGLIVSTATKESSHLLKLKKEGFPLVLVIRHLDEQVDAVITDNMQGAYEGVKLLISRGYKNICLINGKLELDLYRRRYAGFEKAMHEAELEINKNLIRHNIGSWEDSYREMIKVLDQGYLPDAVFATSDPKAFGVIKAIKEKGYSIPDDIAVIGFDNIEMSALVDPPLTTIGQSFYQIGARAAERLIKLINSKRNYKPLIENVPVELIIRQSVGNKTESGS